MPKVKRKCKNCGKEFEVCRSFYSDGREFRWQNITCSPECGAAYLSAILESRGLSQRCNEACNNVTADNADEEFEDVMFEEDFEDGDDEPEIEI